MKKLMKLISIILITNIIIFIPNKSNAICNTIRFTKEVKAVQLTLVDGTIFSNIGVERNVNSNTNLIPNNYKDLNLIFVIETQKDLNENKNAIISFVNKIYEYYGTSAYKIKVGIIPFKDSNTMSWDMPSEKVLKSSLADITNEVNNINSNTTKTLQEALNIAQENFTGNSGGNRNGELLQQLVIITDGIENEEICMNSNVILKDLSNVNMVAMYGMLIEVSKDQNDNMKKLFDGVFEMVVSDNISVSNVKYQLENSVYEYIRQFVVKESTIMPSGGDSNTLLTADRIIITVDEEIVHGAVLQIEYTMSTSRYAFYGSGQIFSNKILDEKDSKLIFERNAKLLTDSSKTNADYGWHMTNEGLVTNSTSSEVKLILSTVITPQQLQGDCIYGNSAKCATSFDVGSGSTANYTLTAKALDVQLLPPFGIENEQKPNDKIQIYIITGVTILVITGIIIMIIKMRRRI